MLVVLSVLSKFLLNPIPEIARIAFYRFLFRVPVGNNVGDVKRNKTLDQRAPFFFHASFSNVNSSLSLQPVLHLPSVAA